MSLYDEKEIREQRVAFGFILYVLLTCVIYTLPYTKFVVPYIIAALIMLGSLLFVIFKQDEDFAMIVLLVFLSVLFSILSFCTGRPFVDSINEGIRNIRFFIPVLWTLYAFKYCNQKQKIFFIILFAVLVAFLFIRTSIELERDPWVARTLAQGKENSTDEVNAYRLSNVGGFEFSYMVGIFTLILIYAALKTEKVILKILFIILILLCFNYIITTMYTTLLLLTVLGMFILLLIHIQSKAAKIALFILGLIILFFLGDIFQLLASIFPKESLLSSKFEAIYLSIKEGDTGELGSRPELIATALNKWIQNPLFGKYNSGSNSHSMIIGILEQTGIVGLFIVSFIFVVFTKMIYSAMKEQGLPTSLFIVSIIYLVLLAFFNPIGYCFEITITIYFIVPLCTQLINSKSE